MDPALPLPTPAVRRSPSLERVERALALVAPQDVPVLVRGEPGSGRSVLARRLHLASRVAAGPCVRVDCQGLGGRPDGVAALERALRGAAGGSVLLEDVDALPAHLQVRLMTWLEQSRGAASAPRVLATTQRDLEVEVRCGGFREDLRARLDVFEIWIPPLRDRPEDVLALARELAAECAERLGMPTPAVPANVERLLCAYPWPGNVRELRSALERAVALSSGPALEVAALPPRILAGTRFS